MGRPKQATKYPLLTLGEVARILGISKKGVTLLREKGKLRRHFSAPPPSGGRPRPMFTRESVKRLKNEYGYVTPPPDPPEEYGDDVT